MPATPQVSDAELMRRVAGGSEDALGTLYGRFARQVFGLALQSLDRAAAEDIVQEVFLAVWHKSSSFDPERGAVRSWLLQIAHHRILNELRRRSRQPEPELDAAGHVLGALPDRDPGPAERTFARHRRAIVESALDELPAAQREAIGLAFFDDLTHEEVAAELNLPLGTAKTRIRAGLQRLRGTLLPRFAAFAALGLLLALGVRYRSQQATLERYDRALSMVTASDSVNVRLAPAPGTSEATHARYRGRPGVETAVVTFSSFPPLPTGEVYQAWVRHGAVWTSLGTIRPEADGSARLIAENPVLATLPEAAEVTIEPVAGSPAPSGRVVVAWGP